VIYSIDERIPDSPYIESFSHGITTRAGSTIRPAENNWHMVLLRYLGNVQLLVVGPLTTSGIVSYEEGGEILWIKFRLGAFMPHLSFRHFQDMEAPLPAAGGKSFWLKSSTWQFPTYDNADTFVDWLVREEIVVRDPLVGAVMQENPHEMSPRTVRHRFLQSTGLTQKHIRQVERAQQAAALLRGGLSILDTVTELGYFDQPHLTRSLKQWVGYTPAQLLQSSKACQIIQDNTPAPDYNLNVLTAIR